MSSKWFKISAMSTCLWKLACHSKFQIPKEPSVYTVHKHYCNLLSMYAKCVFYLCTRDLSHMKSTSTENLRKFHDISQVKCMEKKRGYRPALQIFCFSKNFNICWAVTVAVSLTQTSRVRTMCHTSLKVSHWYNQQHAEDRWLPEKCLVTPAIIDGNLLRHTNPLFS
jgi:hypothetical protein